MKLFNHHVVEDRTTAISANPGLASEWKRDEPKSGVSDDVEWPPTPVMPGDPAKVPGISDRRFRAALTICPDRDVFVNLSGKGRPTPTRRVPWSWPRRSGWPRGGRWA